MAGVARSAAFAVCRLWVPLLRFSRKLVPPDLGSAPCCSFAHRSLCMLPLLQLMSLGASWPTSSARMRATGCAPAVHAVVCICGQAYSDRSMLWCTSGT